MPWEPQIWWNKKFLSWDICSPGIWCLTSVSLVSSVSRQDSDLIFNIQNVLEECRRAGGCENIYIYIYIYIYIWIVYERLADWRSYGENKENIKLCVVTESSFCHQTGSSKVASHIVYYVVSILTKKSPFTSPMALTYQSTIFMLFIYPHCCLV